MPHRSSLAVFLLGCLAGCGPRPNRVSEPFRYEGYTDTAWNGHQRTAQFVTMADGVKIAVDVELPTEYTGPGPAATKFPVVFRYTPYGRSNLIPQTGAIPVPSWATFFLKRGYAIVSADMRGTGGSDGWLNLMDPRARDDGKAVVDWIAAQPWSSGAVGMFGGSYEGWSQLAVASKKPAALKAIAPMVAGWDYVLGQPGGIYSYAFLEMWSALTYHLNRSSPRAPFPIPPTPPVIDEDGDGQLVDEIPLDLDGDGFFYDDYRWPLDRGPTPKYPDGVARTQHHYLSAVMQHVAHPDGAPGTFDGVNVVAPLRFRDDRRPGDSLMAPDLGWAWYPDVLASGVAVLHLAGWWDAFVRSSFELHATAAGRAPSRIIARPAYHQGISPEFARLVGVDSADALLYGDRIMTEILRWYDHWLKGIDNGVEREDPVLAFVMNRGWQSYPSWPPPDARATRWYLDGRSTLGNAAPADSGSDRYRADFTHYSGWGPPQSTEPIALVNGLVGRTEPVTAEFLRNRQFMFRPFLTPEGPPIRTEHDKKALVYTSTPLAEDLEIAGHPVVHLWAGSTAPDGDFFFYLEDVDSAGQAVLVTEYQHRAGFAALRDNDEIIPNNPGIDVKPDLPWHGFRRADYQPNVFAGGRVVEVVTALYPTAWRFRKGHSIRISITAADWPTFALHPDLAPSNRAGAPGNVVPDLTVYRGGGWASYVELPVVGR